ncbi:MULTISPECIES: hypothetical protein [Amycolatopsis]|uniref:Uncharacterized protein n=1 Tax=Amycolatopsis albidoflavus TaxID=102226 RepID=A0ABW5HV21_9PSEU
MLVDYRRCSLGYVATEHLLGYAVARAQLTAMLEDVRESMDRRFHPASVHQTNDRLISGFDT